MGGATALGNDWPAIFAHLKAGRTAVRRMPDWNRYEGLNTRLGAPIPDRVTADRYRRKKTRTMGPVALMAIDATKRCWWMPARSMPPAARRAVRGQRQPRRGR